MIALVLKARPRRICAECGRDAIQPTRCPKCGARVCKDHLARHVERHYLKIPL